ncbi:unnamed protein product [Spirodela intermedia]|uniref:Uncharacterized protein n=1 Tax=Spirodela intermedia TaxID=51605 RepID=A0A7I8K1C9_SPIIN|nr:unnamed protein product [Spirodela intermedia]
MRTLSSLGIGLSLVFGCLFFALVAEVYYLLWWKKRIANRDLQLGYGSPRQQLLHLFRLRKRSSTRPGSLNPQEFSAAAANGNAALDSGGGKELLIKGRGVEEGAESELMRLHNLAGPPRFLFTIKEETKEDLESEEGRSRGDNKSRKSSRGRSLSDMLLVPESPFLTPLSSPPFFTPPVTPMDCYSQQGFNPLFESSKEDNWSKMRSSPPPKFKFLKDAEEKLYRKILLEEATKVNKTQGLPSSARAPPSVGSQEDGSFVTIIVSKSKEQHHHHSSSSQVTPLPSSPPSL